ncbi:MAG: hypothetical protein ABEK50_01300 [bacterium]
MGSGQTRGWIIIGVDLLVVLGIYFLYSQFMVQAPDTKTATIREDLQYKLVVNQSSGDSLPVSFGIVNNHPKSRISQLPNGILLLLTDGQQTRYWSKQIVGPGSMTLGSSETRSWEIDVPLPDDQGPYFVEVFIDKERQTRLQVPT